MAERCLPLVFSLVTPLALRRSSHPDSFASIFLVISLVRRSPKGLYYTDYLLIIIIAGCHTNSQHQANGTLDARRASSLVIAFRTTRAHHLLTVL